MRARASICALGACGPFELARGHQPVHHGCMQPTHTCTHTLAPLSFMCPFAHERAGPRAHISLLLPFLLGHQTGKAGELWARGVKPAGTSLPFNIIDGYCAKIVIGEEQIVPERTKLI